MEPFSLKVSDEITITGLKYIPTQTNGKAVPLVICLPGGTYAADYFEDMVLISRELGIPTIALNREGYKDSTPIPPLSPGKTSMQEQAKHLNKTILPAFWSEYGKASGATSIVLYGHSIGAMISIMVAALHARDAGTYPLAGIISSAISSSWHSDFTSGKVPLPPGPDLTQSHHTWPTELKDAMMLMPQAGYSDPNRLTSGQSERMNNPVPIAEHIDAASPPGESVWTGYWKGYAKGVRCPVWFVIADHDIWSAEDKAVEEFRGAFEQASEVKGEVVRDAPHCVELSFRGPGAMRKGLDRAVEWVGR